MFDGMVSLQTDVFAGGTRDLVRPKLSKTAERKRITEMRGGWCMQALVQSCTFQILLLPNDVVKKWLLLLRNGGRALGISRKYALLAEIFSEYMSYCPVMSGDLKNL